MIFGRGFAWAHMPKTGGDATLEMFRLFPELIEFAHERKSNEKHVRFEKYVDRLEDRRLAMNIRRLPCWTLSLAHHKARYGLYPDRIPLPLASVDEMVQSTAPDRLLRSFIQEGRFKIEYWLRTEYLKTDFLEFISRFTDVDAERESAINSLGHVNRIKYDHELESWFDRKHLITMYENNPLWASIESETYEGLLVDRDPAGSVRADGES